MSFSCLILLAVAGQLIETERQPTTLELAAIESREAIESGHVVFSVVSDQNGDLWHDRVETWFDGDEIRTDHTYDDVGRTPPRDPQPIGSPVCVYRSVSDYAVFHPSDLDYVARFGDADQMPEPHAMHLVDPRNYGMSTIPLTAWPLIVDSTRRSVGRQIGNTVEEATEEIEGVSHQRIRIQVRTNPEVFCTLWLCPNLDGLPTRIVVSGRTEERLETEWAQWGEVWFPKRLELVRVGRDGEVYSRTVTLIEAAEFNLDIDREIFTLAGLEMPVGQVVETRFADGTRSGVWDGEQVVYP